MDHSDETVDLPTCTVLKPDKVQVRKQQPGDLMPSGICLHFRCFASLSGGAGSDAHTPAARVLIHSQSTLYGTHMSTGASAEREFALAVVLT